MMRLKMKSCRGVILIALAAAGTGPTIPTAAAQDITIAERTLFLDKHFSSTGKQKLTYLFHQETSDIPAFDDKATIEVHEQRPDGTASVTTEFLSDQHAIPIPPIEGATGNPIILGFLENDIAKMKRLTGGSVNYFRKRIRLALAAADVRIRNVLVDYNSQAVPGQEITIFPYSEDPQKQRLTPYAEKAYVFVTSGAVPGKVYCIYTTMNNKTDQAADSSLIIAGGDPKQCKSEN